jgi:hypothetical protein
MANSRRKISAAHLALVPERSEGPSSRTEQAELDAKLAVANASKRAREQAKKDVAGRNEQAHKKAIRQLADRDRLKQEMRKGLEF